MIAPSRLRLDGDALVANWKLLDRMSGAAACGAAVKADGYGLGARGVTERLAAAGCRDFFVATWAEGLALADLGVAISVLHGVRAEDPLGAPNLRPVLNTAEQVARWRPTGLPCDVMVDTGMNRLGVSAEEIGAGLLDGLRIETLLSHLACADEESPLNARQLAGFAALKGRTSAKRMSLANSAGIALGADYAFDLTRPGIALYGGVQGPGHAGIRQVVTPESQVLQRRRVRAGDTVGYNATFTAPMDMDVAILNIGYADGYLRCFSGKGLARTGDAVLPVLGRVSMDLVAIGVDAAPGLGEGDWVALDYDLPATSKLSGLSQYELLTGLGARFDRIWY
ncbi:alanine racemase [Sphingomonas sp. JC676]|uniref:alanine racemase n=1 Tax=Sphingomonas sp. JC676 TaxID=2768065 RepID=UPI001657B564|nr:alanine racemase [Sphingomonas sp. JC676]MBC9033151.1 alanine racemase [Sphingomonas sp. JC676]